jgi:hypothetical protein
MSSVDILETTVAEQALRLTKLEKAINGLGESFVEYVNDDKDWSEHIVDGVSRLADGHNANGIFLIMLCMEVGIAPEKMGEMMSLAQRLRRKIAEKVDGDDNKSMDLNGTLEAIQQVLGERH